MKRKIKMILALLFVACVCFTAFACTNGNGGGNGDKITCSLNVTQCTIKRFEDFQLTVLSDKEIDNVEWISLNKNVATVDNGKVVAKSVGSSVIKAVVGNQSLSCLVNVVSNDKMPAVFLSDDQFSLIKNGTLKITPQIMFDGELYGDGTFSFEIEDQNICELQNDVLFAKEYGETVLRVCGSWRSAESILLIKEVPLFVKRDATLIVEQSDFDIYTENGVSGTENYSTERTLTANLYIENVINTQKTVEWKVSDDSLINVTENGKVTVNKDGNTGIAYVWAEVNEDNVSVSSDMIEVSVLKPVIDKTEQISLIHDMSVKTQSINDNYVFGKETEILSVVDTVSPTNELFKDGVVEYFSNVASEREWIISAKTYSVKVKVKCVTKVLYNVKDLNDMDNVAYPKNYNEQAINSFSGWFVLANDIDYEGKTYVSEVQLSSGYGGRWENAIFDGQGYSIKNITFNKYGFFGVRAKDCVFKNVAIIDAKLTSSSSCVVTNQFYGTSVIENVFVRATSTVQSGSFVNVLVGSLQDQKPNLSRIRDVVVDVISATNMDHLSGIVRTSVPSPKLEVFDAVYTIGAKVNVGTRIGIDGKYNGDTKLDVNLKKVAENNEGYVGGSYQTDQEFLNEKEQIFNGDFAKVFVLTQESGQTVLKFMGNTVKVFNV